eukprot:scaffold603_cov404-Prasinococcus_capsulatus_cf.AAC.47
MSVYTPAQHERGVKSSHRPSTTPRNYVAENRVTEKVRALHILGQLLVGLQVVRQVLPDQPQAGLIVVEVELVCWVAGSPRLHEFVQVVRHRQARVGLVYDSGNGLAVRRRRGRRHVWANVVHLRRVRRVPFDTLKVAVPHAAVRCNRLAGPKIAM